MINKKDKNYFRFFVPAEIVKAKDKEGKTVMRLGGIASTIDTDKDGENLDVSGFNIKPLLKSGFTNWHHGQKKDARCIIGEPDKAEIRKEGLYVETTLYPDSEMAKGVYELAQTLEKNSKTRRLGFSIEGIATSRDKDNPAFVKTADVTGLAITFAPKCPSTICNIIKGETNNFDEEYEVPEEVTKSESFNLLAQVESEGATVTIEKGGKVNVKLKKSMTTESAAPLKKESLEGKKKDIEEDEVEETTEEKNKKKKIFTKGETFDKIFTDFPDIDIEKATKIFTLIQKQNSNEMTKTITTEQINAAYDLLEKAAATEVVDETETTTEVIKKEDAIFKAVKSGAITVYKKMKKDTDGKLVSADEKIYQKLEKGGYEAMEEEVDEKEAIQKAIEESQLNFKEHVVGIGLKADKLEKAFNSSDARNVELYKAFGTILKAIKEDSEELIKGMTEQFEELNEKFDSISQEPGRAKSKTRGIERFNKAEEDGDLKKGETTYSLSRNKKEILEILDIATFEKGGSPDAEFEKAMTVYESSNFLSPKIQQRLLLERKIGITA